MNVVDLKEVTEINGKTYHLNKMVSNDFYGGVQVILRRIAVIPCLGIGIQLKDSKTYLSYFHDMMHAKNPSNLLFTGKWFNLNKPIKELNKERVNELIKSSIIVKESDLLTSYLNNLIKKYYNDFKS